MSKLKLINILKNKILEQAPIGFYDTDEEPGVYYSSNLETGEIKKIDVNAIKNITKLDFSTIDLNNPFLIKPSTKRGSPFNQNRGINAKTGNPILHKGIDYRVGVGTNVLLIKPGNVTVADMNADPNGYGAVIYVKHDDGTFTRYGHMSKIDVTEGERIETPKIIGKTGGLPGSVGAGNSQGPHLHFEYRLGDVAEDPSSNNNDDSVYRFLNDSDIDKLNLKDNVVVSNEEPKLTGSNKYIVGKKMSIDKNGPKNHIPRKLGNWESDNATDIPESPGTTVYSITNGTVSSIGGDQNDHEGKIYGASISVKGSNGYPDIFYTHLQNVKVSVGEKVTLGTPLAEISKWESGTYHHVHVGLPWGKELSDLIDLNTGEIYNPSV